MVIKLQHCVPKSHTPSISLTYSYIYFPCWIYATCHSYRVQHILTAWSRNLSDKNKNALITYKTKPTTGFKCNRQKYSNDDLDKLGHNSVRKTEKKQTYT